jgi:hypothetical protein
MRYQRYQAKVALRWKLVREEGDRIGRRYSKLIESIVDQEKRRQLKLSIQETSQSRLKLNKNNSRASLSSVDRMAEYTQIMITMTSKSNSPKAKRNRLFLQNRGFITTN